MSLLLNALTLILALIPLPSFTTHVVNQFETQAYPSPTIATLPPYESIAVPVKVEEAPLQLSAASAYAVDLTSNQVLYNSHGDVKRPIASITKLVTALIILQRHQISEVVTVPQLPPYNPGDERIGLQPGMRITISDLLAALLIQSGNDAADTLAIIDSGSREGFAVKMNQFVKEWGIKEAQFSNPSGLSDVNNGASAEALAKIGALALLNPTITGLIKTPSATITTKEGRVLQLATTNQLLHSKQFNGIKTGYTLAAGQCFVGLTTIQGHRVITVILGSQDRFGESKALADWINATYRWQ